MKRRIATVVTAGTLGTASVLGIGLVAPGARAHADRGAEAVSQDPGDGDDEDAAGGDGADGDEVAAAAGERSGPATSPADLLPESDQGYRVLTATATSDSAVGILGPGGTNLTTAARVLGMDVPTVRAELESGATLGELARARGVEQVALVRALAQEQEARLERWLGHV